MYTLGGVVVDGIRRQRLLREDGRTPRTVQLANHRAAARILWVAHPVHAWTEYGDDLTDLASAAAFFGVSPSDVATVRRLVRGETRSNPTKWRAQYQHRWNAAQRYLGRVRQGTCPLTLQGIENALQLPPHK